MTSSFEKTETNSSHSLLRTFDCVVLASDIQDKIQERLKTLSFTAKISGFRPGKIPLSLLSQRYGKQVEAEVLEKLSEEKADMTLREQGVRPALRPEITFEPYQSGQNLNFKISLEIMPAIEVPDYTQFSFDRFVVSVQEKALQEAKERLALLFGKTEDIAEERPVQPEDLVVGTLRFFSGDKEIPGRGGEDSLVDLGKADLSEEIKNSLLGKVVGDIVEIKPSFLPTSEGDSLEEVARFTVKKLCRHVPVSLDEAFVKNLGYADVKAFDAYVEKLLLDRYSHQSFLCVKHDVLNQLDAGKPFDIPEGLVKMEMQSILKEYEEIQKKNSSAAPSGENSEKESRRMAERRVRLAFVLGEIGRLNKIGIPEKLVQQELARQASSYPGQEKKIVDFYKNNPSAMASLKAPLFEDMVIQHILDKAQVKEVEITAEGLEKKVHDLTSDNEM